MNTGFDDLDKIIDIGQPGVTLLVGTTFVNTFSGDIANNVCLEQECEVLEIVNCSKEYLIKRMLVNRCNIDYRKWTQKNQYTDKEFQKIGKNMVDLIETTKRLPTIIEQEGNLYDLKNIEKVILNYANIYADREDIKSLVVLSIYPFRSPISRLKDMEKYIKEKIRLIKKLRKISYKFRCPIIIVNNIDITKLYNQDKNITDYITKKDINNINRINKYINKFIILNLNVDEKIENKHVFDVDVYNTNEKTGSCKLKYDIRCRKFEDYK